MNKTWVICTAMLSVAIVAAAAAVLFSGRYFFHVHHSSPLPIVYRCDRLTGSIDIVSAGGDLRLGVQAAKTPEASPAPSQTTSKPAPAPPASPRPTAPHPDKAFEELDELNRRFGITP